MAGTWVTLLCVLPLAIAVPGGHRQGRIMNGPIRPPVAGAALNTNSWVDPSGDEASEIYTVVRPPPNFWPPHEERVPAESSGLGLVTIPAPALTTKPTTTTTTEPPFVPDPVPSLKNHRIVPIENKVYNNSAVEKKKNVHRIGITLPPDTRSTTDGPFKNKGKRVDMEKFRECVFFKTCPKAECFYFGRYNKCKSEGKKTE